MDVENGQVVKCVQFENPSLIGNPAEIGMRYEAQGADELIYLDITASLQNRQAVIPWIEKIAASIHIPFCVVGGVRTIEDFRTILLAGADKVGLNTGAVENPGLITEAARRFGSQCVVITIDARRRREGFWEVYTHSGKRPTGLDCLKWAAYVEKLGAGEIVYTSIEADGTRQGYDLELLQQLTGAVSIPVVASGGAGSLEHIRDAFVKARVDAALVASVLHYGDLTVGEIKSYLHQEGIPVRLV